MSRAASATARWIVVPPIQYQAVWRSAVAKAVEAAGLRLHDLDAAPETAPFNDPNVVILTSDANQVVLAGAPVDAVAGLMADSGIRIGHGDEAPHDLQAVTALLGRIGLLPPERIFRSDDFNAGPVEILKGVKLQRPGLPAQTPLSARAKAVIDAVALLDPAQPRAIWAPELFNYDSRTAPGGTQGQLDLTGRPRFLITGPYIVMPAGRYRTTYQLSFDEKGSRPRFRVDWGGIEDYASEEFVPGRPGAFKITQEYLWAEAAPCELRIIVMEGVFEGRMTFSGAEIVRID